MIKYHKLKLLLFNKQSANFLIYGFGQFFNLVTPLIAVPYIIDVCGIANFGKTSLAMAVVFFVIVIIDFGSDIVGVKDVSNNRDNFVALQKIYTLNMVARFVLLISTLFVLSIMFYFLPYFQQEKAVFLMSLPVLVGQYLNPTWVLQGLEQFKLISFLNVFSKILYLVFVFVFIKSPSDYVLINVFWALGMIISFGFGILYCLKKKHLKFINVTKGEAVKFITDGFPFCISQLFLSFKNYSPIMVISFLGGFSVAGFYKIIEQIISIFRTYLQIMFRFFYPKICYKLSSNFSSGIAFWRNVNVINFILLLFMLIAVFAFAEKILFFFKVTPSDIPFVMPALRFSLLLPALTAVSYAVEQLLFGTEQKKIYIKITIITVLINLLLMYVLCKKYQITGLLTALMITEFVVIMCYGLVIFAFLENKKNEFKN